MQTFKKGQKVRTCYGTIETVSQQVGTQVFTYESLTDWYHPSKVAIIHI